MFNQNDEVHAALCLGATAASLPLVFKMSPVMLAATNLVSTSTQFGTQFYVSCVSGPTMFLNLERSKFGDLQSRLFPKYGMVGVSTSILGLASYHISHDSLLDLGSYLLIGSLLANLLNSFLLFPVTTRYMLENRAAKAKGEGSAEAVAAGRRFGISHGISNLVNLGSLLANLGYFYIIASRIAGSW